MNQPPDQIAAVNEQAYFSAPQAWARTLERNGKFEEYARQEPDVNGAPKLSKLQEMLSSKTRPMLVAAALRAIAYARGPAPAQRLPSPTRKVPELQVLTN